MMGRIINWELVRRARQLYARGMKIKQIAKELNLSPRTISKYLKIKPAKSEDEELQIILKAFKGLREGSFNDPVDLVINLKIPPSKAEEIFDKFIRLDSKKLCKAEEIEELNERFSRLAKNLRFLAAQLGCKLICPECEEVVKVEYDKKLGDFVCEKCREVIE